MVGLSQCYLSLLDRRGVFLILFLQIEMLNNEVPDLRIVWRPRSPHRLSPLAHQPRVILGRFYQSNVENGHCSHVRRPWHVDVGPDSNYPGKPLK